MSLCHIKTVVVEMMMVMIIIGFVAIAVANEYLIM
jgi:hypothetical protein